eukprot:Plantae.Rhodophyta-Purpureofilum_apyrenoidigerum.ctg15996.p1 GENE.Plantae.Rhodophyta-Purpureofilum_apyrenoidigerum.ctg15996~~Plantae.Rhodophyta-Purpureofilum_apyrenoidigerum.ctg15996.p1  ORF type:complete len:357 (+),score=64.04 Plantae.Rhodophyta-Purpureofilum_apyrenoidigerum.ctg15996:85-1155(+)
MMDMGEENIETQRAIESEMHLRKAQEEEDRRMAAMLTSQSDAQIGLQLSNGRSMQDVMGYQEALGLDPSNVLSHHDVAEITRKDIVSTIAAQMQKLAPGHHYVRCHISSTMDYFGSNVWGHGWDCGYKNLQMMFSSLLQNSRLAAHLRKYDIKEVPSLPELQGRIEGAWRLGFDLEGKAELGGTLLDETKWIGSSEVAALLRSLRIRAEVVEFSSSADNINAGRDQLFTWVENYYTDLCNPKKSRNLFNPLKCQVCGGRKGKIFIPPLFLQDPQHSRTVIGADIYRHDQTRILVMDPNMSFGKELKKKASFDRFALPKSAEQLSATSFHVVYIPSNPFYDDDTEWQLSKQVVSRRP